MNRPEVESFRPEVNMHGHEVLLRTDPSGITAIVPAGVMLNHPKAPEILRWRWRLARWSSRLAFSQDASPELVVPVALSEVITEQPKWATWMLYTEAQHIEGVHAYYSEDPMARIPGSPAAPLALLGEAEQAAEAASHLEDVSPLVPTLVTGAVNFARPLFEKLANRPS